MTLKVDVRFKVSEDFTRLRGSSLLKKVKFFWRRGWMEIPVIMASSFLFAAGLGMTSYAVHYGTTYDITPKYHDDIKIYRPGDPRIQKIRTAASTFD